MSGTTQAASPVRTRPAPPVRIVHLGVGAFSRSHTAWFTAHAADAEAWGIAAYTGTSSSLADALNAQDGVYTLVVRSADGDTAEVIESLVRAHPGGDLEHLVADLAAAQTAIVTLTITEAGYRASPDGDPDLSDPMVVADLESLAAMEEATDLGAVPVRTALGRLVLGLEARRRAGGAPIAVVSCDNLPDNGGTLRRAVLSLAAASPVTEEWCEASVSFVSTSVDRITPRVGDADARALAECYRDPVVVIAEPFADWVLSGEFPAGRPQWEAAGARFTDELEPWEARKLWLLNGAHSILACLGPMRGHREVAEAIADPVCRGAVERFWDEAERHLPVSLDVARYRDDLLARFDNPRIVHLLSQIAGDMITKLRLRIAPVARLERAQGRDAAACAEAFAVWMLGQLSDDAELAEVREQLRRVDAALAADVDFVHRVRSTAVDRRSLTLA